MKTITQINQELENIENEYTYESFKYLIYELTDIINLSQDYLVNNWELVKLQFFHYNNTDLGIGLYAELYFNNEIENGEFRIDLLSHENDKLELSNDIIHPKLQERIQHFKKEFFMNNYRTITNIAYELRAINIERTQKIKFCEYKKNDNVEEFIQEVLGEKFYARLEKEKLEENITQSKTIYKKLKV